VQVSANGNVLRSEIVGAVKMRVYLSGMPELRLGLNDKVLFESTGSKFGVTLVTTFHVANTQTLLFQVNTLHHINMLIDVKVNTH